MDTIAYLLIGAVPSIPLAFLVSLKTSIYTTYSVFNSLKHNFCAYDLGHQTEIYE